MCTALRQPGCKLRELVLWEGSIDAAGVEVLAKALAAEKTSVEVLNMGYCGLGAECVAPLVEMLKVNTTLTELYLERNEFDEAAKQQLKDAVKEYRGRTGVELGELVV